MSLKIESHWVLLFPSKMEELDAVINDRQLSKIAEITQFYQNLKIQVQTILTEVGYDNLPITKEIPFKVMCYDIRPIKEVSTLEHFQQNQEKLTQCLDEIITYELAHHNIAGVDRQIVISGFTVEETYVTVHAVCVIRKPPIDIVHIENYFHNFIRQLASYKSDSVKDIIDLICPQECLETNIQLGQFFLTEN